MQTLPKLHCMHVQDPAAVHCTAMHNTGTSIQLLRVRDMYAVLQQPHHTARAAIGAVTG